MLYQLELFYKSDEQMILETEEYFNYLENPNKAFSDMPVCPFLKAERLSDKIFVQVWQPSTNSLNILFQEFFESKYSSALFICRDTKDIKWRDVSRKSYQKTIQGFLKPTEYKALCLSPYEDFVVGGEPTRKKSPYFLVNIATRKEFKNAHRGLLKTKYFDKFSDEEIKKLKVYPKEKND